VECPSCHAETPDVGKFCVACGATLPGRCPSCGSANPSGAKFCLECGEQLSAVQAESTTKPGATVVARGRVAPASAERRQLTIMLCDLVGSTALSARLDPEDMREIIGVYHRCCAEQITQQGGFVAKYMGDGVLAYFGYPRAHEDDAERAVRAALAVIEAVPKLRAGHDAVLQVRVGIATGLVVVGDLIGEGVAQEHGVVGDTPNLAARLQALAAPGQVVISGSTRRLTGGMFDYRDLGRVTLKGLADPVQAWRVTGTSDVQSRFEAHHETNLTPLVGREEELELLLRGWRQAMRGEGRVVLLSGEPGIGKSRLTVALQERLQEEPHTRLRYFCSQQHTDSALYPLISQLRRAAQFNPDNTSEPPVAKFASSLAPVSALAGLERDHQPEQKLAALEALLRASPGHDEQSVALLADVLSVPAGGKYRLSELSPRRRKEKVLEALLAGLEAFANQKPVLTVFEDVHWIDPTSLEALTSIVEPVSRLRVLLVITARPEFVPKWPAYAHVTTVPLARLNQRDAAAVVTGVTGGKALPREVLKEIITRTDGVPLFLEELSKSVLESGALIEEEERYVLARPLEHRAIPATLHASLFARIDRLGSAREVAQIAAVIGREFSHELLRAVGRLTEDNLRKGLNQLVDAELVFRRGTPPNAAYSFKHALVGEAVYATLLRSQRQALHRRVLEELERQFPETAVDEPERLAQHCDAAGFADKAAIYWLKAGQQAVAGSAMTEAVAQLTKGLEVLKALPKSTARQKHELDLRIALGPALIATQGWAAPVVGETYARAAELCERLEQWHHLGAVLFGQITHHHLRGELRLACERAEAVRRLGEARNDLILLWLGRHMVGDTRVSLGEFTLGRADLEQCLVVFDPGYRRAINALTGADEHVTTLLHLSKTLACLGYLDQARARREAALVEARRLAHAYTLAVALLMGLYTERGELTADARLPLAEELLALSAEHGFPVLQALGAVHRGWCLSMAGREGEGIAQVTEGLASYRSTGAVRALPYLFTLLAEADSTAGQPAEGLRHLAEAVRIMERTEERDFEAEVYRVRGELLLAVGDRTAAAESFRAALAVARRQSAGLWELRASTSLARLWRDQGKRTEARDLLAPIYGWFTEGLDTPVLKEAKALLDELG
jgi:class 3 adenylate cyclase/predicted ATPase